MLAKRLYFHWPTLVNLFRLSLPIMVSQGASAMMIFTDRFFLAQIGPVHMAASLGGGMAWFFCISLFNGVLAYANALVAQHYGAQEAEKCSRVVTQGFILSVACIPLFLFIAYLVSGLFEAMGHDPQQVELELRYFYILMFGSVLVLVKTTLASFFSGIGRSKVVMIADLLGVGLNIPLSYILIFGKLGFPALDISGAAIATLISTLFSIVILLLAYGEAWIRTTFRVAESFRFDRSIMSRYLRLGLPSGLELFLNIAAFNLFLLMFQSYGIVEAASATIVFNWDVVCFVPMMGLNIGVMSLIGRYVGARNMELVNQATSAGLFIGLGYSFFLAVIFVLFRTPLVNVFIFSEQEAAGIRSLASFMMIGLGTYCMLDAVILVVSGVLRGAGDTRWIMFTSVSLHWAMLFAQYLIIKVFDIGPKVSWLAFVMMVFSIATVFTLRLIAGKWRDPVVLNKILTS